jgi:hypothetical protein
LESWRIYLQEAQCQLEFAKRSYNEFEVALLENDTIAIFYRLHHFIVHVTNIDKLLDTETNSVRHNLLSQRINLSDIDLKSIRRLRNHLEHFDERLDKWVSKHDGCAFFDMNIVTNAKGFPKSLFLRAIDGYTFKFYGEDYPLKQIYESLIELEARINNADSVKAL